jgi:hypothetical protein
VSFTKVQWSQKCCGYIGNSNIFCIDNNHNKLNHCGTVAHAERKFTPESTTYYAPTGLRYGRHTPDSTISIKFNQVPNCLKQTFASGELTRNKWPAIFQQKLSDNSTQPLLTINGIMDCLHPGDELVLRCNGNDDTSSHYSFDDDPHTLDT